MKKKITVVALIVVILAIVVISGSLAWFQEEDKVSNTFIIGDIKIEQHEQEHDENNQLQDFTQNQLLYPIINPNDPQNDKYYIEKLVSVENIGTNDAYVRTFIAYPAVLEDILILDINTTEWIKDNQAWTNLIINNIEYKIISYTYNSSIQKDETTSYLLKGVYLDASVDAKYNPNVKDGEGNPTKQFCTLNTDGTFTFYYYDISKPIDILVSSQACQVKGLGTNPQEAINTAFGMTPPDFRSN